MPCADMDLLKHLYERFNARDMDAVVAMLHFDVLWANGMEGGHVSGHRGVRDYWTRQWAMIDPHVEPVSFSTPADGGVAVEVQQTVRNLSGNILSERIVQHVFRMEHGLIRRFDIG
jgi:hypothetical protein